MENLERIEIILKEQKEILKQKYGIKELGIFGSYVRGQTDKTSDLDILVEFTRRLGLLKFIEIENYLSNILGVNVDLVMKGALKPRIGRHILKEVVYI